MGLLYNKISFSDSFENLKVMLELDHQQGYQNEGVDRLSPASP